MISIAKAWKKLITKKEKKIHLIASQDVDR